MVFNGLIYQLMLLAYSDSVIIQMNKFSLTCTPDYHNLQQDDKDRPFQIPLPYKA